MDPLDPLTEIVKSGQGFSSFILIERFIWLLIGFFFMGAISTSMQKGMKDQGWFGNKSFEIGINKKIRKKDKEPDEDTINTEKK